MPDPHEILGVAPGTAPAGLHRAFKKAVRRNHPDLNPGDPRAAERLRAVITAYQQLTGAPAKAAPQKAAPPPRAPGALLAVCQLRGADLFGLLAVERAELPRDGWLAVELKALDACGVCGGSGWEEVAASWGRVDRWECETCAGGGILRVERKVRVKVPAPPTDGARIRLRGVGLPRPGMDRGDAILVLRLK